jgi:taurine transport system substrate-binding protein
MKQERITFLLWIVGFFALMASGCSRTPSRSAVQETGSLEIAEALPKEIRLGYFQSPNGELLAKGKGLLEKRFPTVKISWILFEVGRDVNTAMASNSLDIATIGTPPGTSGIANGLPYKIYYIHDVIGASEALVVKETAGVIDIQDIRGKTIATPFSSTSHFSFLAALRQHNIPENEVTILDMNGPDIIAAWTRGNIDGTYIWQPAQARLLELGGRVVITSEVIAAAGDLTGEFGIVSNQFTEKYPHVVKAYIDILDEATTSYHSRSKDAVDVIAAELGLSVEDTLMTMDQVFVLGKKDQTKSAYLGTAQNPGQLPVLLQKTAEFLFKQGALTSQPGPEVFSNAIGYQFYD